MVKAERYRYFEIIFPNMATSLLFDNLVLTYAITAKIEVDFSPPPVPDGDAPTNIKMTIIINKDGCKLPMSAVLNPTVDIAVMD